MFVHKLTKGSLTLWHTNADKSGNITIAVVEGYRNEKTLEIVLPEFHQVRNSLTKEDCISYFDLIIEEYRSILKNIKDEDYYTTYLLKVSRLLESNGLRSSDNYIHVMRIKADGYLQYYDKQAMSPLQRIVSGIKSSVSAKPDPIAMLREMANKDK